jgi:hypothetical protein
VNEQTLKIIEAAAKSAQIDGYFDRPTDEIAGTICVLVDVIRRMTIERQQLLVGMDLLIDLSKALQDDYGLLNVALGMSVDHQPDFARRNRLIEQIESHARKIAMREMVENAQSLMDALESAREGNSK